MNLAILTDKKTLQLLAIFALAMLACSKVGAQVGQRTYPADLYYQSNDILYAGELKQAVKAYRASARQGYAIGNGRWVDSICYYTMIGECLYQAGDLAGAIEQYDAALSIYLSDPAWVKHVEFPIENAPATSAVERARINWGKTTRTTVIANVPDRMSVLIGSDINQALNQGGVVQSPEYRGFNVHEVVRCTALAMSRRHEILGPLSKHDAFARKLSAAAEGGLGSKHPLAVSWGNLLIGIASASMGEDDKAALPLQNAIQAASRYDHPLTPLALLELAKLHFRNGKFDEAELLAMEASYSGAIFGQQDVIAEAFTLATRVHLVKNREGVYAPLSLASTWARTKGSKQLQATLPLLAAQCATESGMVKDAASLIGAARSPMNRNDLSNAAIGGEFLFRSAQVSFQQGNLAEGLAGIDRALKIKSASSKWLFRIAIADRLYLSGSVTPHGANDIFKELLREPRNEDWLADPIETLTYVSAAQLREREHWFEIALAKKDYQQALEIADGIRRKRFYSSLPIGGRLLALQWMLESNPDQLTLEVAKLRQAFLLKYPLYENLSDKSRQLQTQLRNMPLVPDPESDDFKLQRGLLEQLQQISAAQEVFLADVALRREPSPFVFPPQLDFIETQKKLGEKQVVLSFLSTDKGIYSFLLTKDKYAFQEFTNPAHVRKYLGDLLRKLGHLDANTQLNAEVFEDQSWKEPASSLLKLLLPKVPAEFWGNYEELVVVPDGLLWYLPFEILQVVEKENATNLSDKIKIRYAPTVALAVNGKKNQKVESNTAFITGKLNSGDDLEISSSAFDAIKDQIPGAEKIPFKLPAPSYVLSALCDKLVVWDDMDESTRTGPYGWSPMQIDKGKVGGDMQSWLGLPFSGPTHYVLPGFHTIAAGGMRQKGSGDEVFLTVCGLMASGARTILLSRWRVGGDSAYELTEVFLEELADKSPVDAWQSSVKNLTSQNLEIEYEARIKKSASVNSVKGSHPFFWAGYMLIDDGSYSPK